MRVRRGLAGVAVFKVDKDSEVVNIDLLLAGVRISRSRGTYRYSKYYAALNEVVSGLGIRLAGLRARDYLCYHDRAPVLCRVYVTPDGRKAKYVVLASLQTGVLMRIAQALLKAGWRKEFLFEIAAKRGIAHRGL